MSLEIGDIDITEVKQVEEDEQTVLARVVDQLQKVEGQKQLFTHQLDLAQTKLVEDFEKKAQELLVELRATYMPIAMQNTEALEAAKNTLEGKYITVTTSVVDSLFNNAFERRHYGYRPAWMASSSSSAAASSSSSSSSSSLLTKLMESSDADLLQSFMEDVVGKKKAKLAEEERQRERELEKERQATQEVKATQERVDSALSQILPVFGHLTLEQAVYAIKINHDKADQAVDWLLNHDLEELTDRMAKDEAKENEQKVKDAQKQKQKEKEKEKEQDKGSSASSSDKEESKLDKLAPLPGPPPLVRSLSLRTEHSVTYRVEKIRASGEVELQAILDRNRIPLAPFGSSSSSSVPSTLPSATMSSFDSSPSSASLAYPASAPPTRRVVSLDKMVQGGFKVLNAEEVRGVMLDCQERAPHILYQAYEDDSISPVHIQPALRMAEYEISSNQRSHSNSRIDYVYHKHDGCIMFTSQEDFGTNPLIHAVPLQLYTQAIDEHTHNIVHMHLNALSEDELTVDSMNLTGQAKTLDECMTFENDISGRRLSHRFVAKDQKMESVLYSDGSEIKRAPFTEIAAPVEGAYVTLSDGRVGRVVRVPHGMIITNQPDRLPSQKDEAGQASDFSTCANKHPDDLPGRMEVMVLMDGGQAVDEGSVVVRVPVCRLTPLPAEHIEAKLNQAQQALKDSRNEQWLTSLTKLETQIRWQESKSADRPADAVLLPLAELHQLKQRIDTLSTLPGVTKPDDYDNRVRALARSLRALALTQRR